MILATLMLVTCEQVDAPGNFLEYDIPGQRIELVWNMVSHDGSVKTWREPLVSESHASGYPYQFSGCKAVASQGVSKVRFEYSCGDFTQGKLEITVGQSDQFYSKTWINGGFTERRVRLKNCK
jgi:hypothetical protein